MDPTRYLTNHELAVAVRGLIWRVTSGKGSTSPSDRQAAAEAVLGGPLGKYLDKVRSQATSVTDEEVAALRSAGHSDDELFELTIATALGAASDRMAAGLRAIAESFDSSAARAPSEATAKTPVTIEPAVVEPAVVEPAVVEPAVVEPAVVEPAVLEPAAVEPNPVT